VWDGSAGNVGLGLVEEMVECSAIKFSLC
jgi:hypothetical protein